MKTRINIDVILQKSKKHIKEVEFFHPSGKSLPNGSYIQRGGFLHECRQNKESYTIDKIMHDTNNGLSVKYKGGIITFVTTFKLSAFLIKEVEQAIETYCCTYNKCAVTYNVGKSFYGKYIGDKGEVYDEESLSVEINALTSKSLIKLSEYLADTFSQETLLVKDLNENKIFMLY